MAAPAAVATRYATTLDRLANRSQRALERIYAGLGTWDEPASDQFHDLAVPIVTSTATAAQQATAGYLYAITGAMPAPASPLIVPDAAARCYDPFDRLARNLANNMPWSEAVKGGKSVAGSLGEDAVFRTARSSIADMGVDLRDWQRRLSAGCCQWCMKLSTVVFDAAHNATFGHSHCRCIPVPVDAIGSHNDKVREANQWDAQAEQLYNQRHARKRLSDSAKNAQKRSDQAAADALIEPDPARRDRLETRAQEWETRAERASEQLRILETGTHRLAA